jgi:hypothetical protein
MAMTPPYSNDQHSAAAAIPVFITGNAGSSSVPTPPTPPPATLGAGASWNSGLMNAAGFNRFSAAATLSQAGTLVIQRYIDPAGAIPIGTAPTQAMAAGVPAWTWINDGMAASTWQVTITNTSGAVANLTNVALLQSA